MKKSYRINQERIYTEALNSVGIKPKKVTAHRDASATCPTNEKATPKIKQLVTSLGGEIISEGATEITILIPAALEYHKANPPLVTELERAEMEAMKAQRKAEKASKPNANSVEIDE